MIKIAITGGAGFVGSNLAHRLSSKGFEIVIIDDLSSGLESNLAGLNIQLKKITILDFENTQKALKDCDVVVHLAARGSVPRSVKDPLATHAVNTQGTLNILEICRNNDSHLVYSSSSSVYGSNLALPKNEKMWMQPLSPYAASKLGAEGFVSAYASTYDLKTTPLRFFNIFGPRQRPDHEYAAVIPKWIWGGLNGDTIEVFGDGSHTRDFTYIDTVCDVISAAIEEKIYDKEFTNLAYGNNISLIEVIEMLKKFFPDLNVRFTSPRIGDVKDSQNDPIKIKSLFPKIKPVEFESALEETYLWLKKSFEN